MNHARSRISPITRRRSGGHVRDDGKAYVPGRHSRLTLNVLLSFAQFEREVIGERVRDKIAASKRKGIWVGGPVPLGYRCIAKKLVVVPEEAETVRTIFRRYLELGSMGALIEDLDRRGIRTKANARL